MRFMVTVMPVCAAAVVQEVPFHTGTQLVVETVTVKDKSGKPIDRLTANDFHITEDGVPQTIRFFEYHSLPAASEPLAAFTESVAPFSKIPRNRIGPDRPGD